ncbi:MAG: phosphate acyltransferase PlsX [Planctomycetota bacterium]|nr:phosphate acyltransferase PlsX [Planctomycetota bacterium]
MRLAIDAMGSDRGHEPIVAGVAEYLRREPDVTVIMVGDEAVLKEDLRRRGVDPRPGRVEIVHASQVMEMHDKVADLREKRDSSIMRLVEVLKSGQADAMVALGNTAAAVAASVIGLGLLQGVRRAGIAVPLPTRGGHPCVVIDMGANTVAKARHLRDYAIMASIYCEKVLGTVRPRVGLLNVGEERGKGNDLLREAFLMLEKAPINFLGNVEGDDIYAGTCDVIVCDGFIGNVVLKVSEELAATVAHWMRDAFRSSWQTRLGAMLAYGAFRILRKRISYDQYGGAPLLGVNGICIIGHGKSNAEAVYNALRVAKESVTVGLNRLIREELARVADLVESESAAANL